MTKKEDLRIIKTKKNLYEGLLTLMKDKTFEEIKVSDICEIALTNRSTFYDHFSDKYELLASLIWDLEKELAVRLEKNNELDTAKAYYMEMISLLFDHISDNITTYTSIIKNNNNSIASDMFFDTLRKDVLKHMKDSNRYHGTIPLEIITSFYVSAVINVCIDYIKNPNQYKKEEILIYLDELLPNELY